ncbi:hypothetical protein [Hallerella succinigenes]|nr:hypothetical protein [Hallerella succinigenes]MDD6091421.1 hypothetical protein [Hallerella succinigenes]
MPGVACCATVAHVVGRRNGYSFYPWLFKVNVKVGENRTTVRKGLYLN